MKKNIEEIAKEDGRYETEAIKFVYEGLGYTVRDLAEEKGLGPRRFASHNEAAGQPRHISGRQLAEGLRDLALERWGRLAKLVLEHWGVKTTSDFGEIVYLMIKHQWMTCQANDRIEDFDNVYEFKTVFEDQFELELSGPIG